MRHLVSGIGLIIALVAFTAAKNANAMCNGNCITTQLWEHAAAGRVVQSSSGEEGAGFYSRDGRTYLGSDPDSYLSLGPVADESTPPGPSTSWRTQEIFWTGDGDLYGMVYEVRRRQIIVYTEVEDWAIASCDSDCDGLSDSWEKNHHSNLDGNASTDLDNDGVPAIVELITGTDPGDPEDYEKQGNYYLYDIKGRIRHIYRME